MIKSFIEKYNLSGTFIVAFSGGYDSMCLLDMLDKEGYDVVAVHLNHNWRGDESKNEAICCENFAKLRGIKFYSETLDADIPPTETAGREARYDFFRRCAKNFNSNVVFTAHNYNDNAETVLYRIIKGTGIVGLQGIAEHRDIFYRPLLSMKRDDIEKYCNDDLGKVKEITLAYLNNREVKYEDITPMLYIRAAMEGFRSYKNVKHILIDEAQDYSPLFYELIRKSFKNAAITIMGDLNQRIDEHSNVKSRNAITEIFNDIKIEVLSKSYRSTANITNFTRELLDTHEPIEAVERRGDNPKIIITENKIAEIAKTIEAMQEKGYKSIAVICKTKAITNDVYNKLKEVLDEINLIDTETSEFKVGVNVISSYLSKGLEFDGVIVADGEEYLNESNKNLFYTVCTRALHELKIFTNKDLAEMLPKDKTLYEVEE